MIQNDPKNGELGELNETIMGQQLKTMEDHFFTTTDLPNLTDFFLLSKIIQNDPKNLFFIVHELSELNKRFYEVNN